MNCIRINIFILSLLSAGTVFAQVQTTDTILQLKDVTVTALREKDFSNGMQLQHFDSIQRATYQINSLADLLGAESEMFIKLYGVGNIATATMRGSNAAQTAVLWNGFSINNPMLGQSDLSIIPSSFMDNITVEPGGGSALWGSGAVGGVVRMNTSPQFNEGWSFEAGTAVGSFNYYQQHAQVKFSNSKWYSSIRFFQEQAKNDFFFHNHTLLDNPLQRQQHAQTKAFGLMNENVYNINDKNRLNLAVWWQRDYRQLPPTVIQQQSEAFQKDKVFRLSSQWTHYNQMSTYAVRTALFNDIIDYDDNLSNIQSNSNALTWIAEAEGKWHVGKHRIINAGINNTLNTAKADNFSDKVNENKIALFISESATFFKGKLKPLVAARQEFTSQGYSPFTWTAAIEYNLIPKINIKANVSRVFRQPTLNDRYWVPGGNPELKPEKGRTADAGIEFKQNYKEQRLQWLIYATLFSREMNNQIIWLPTDNFWQPQNIQEVWSRGVETNNTANLRMKQFKLTFNMTTAYTLSTNQKKISENDASLNKQLIYVPLYNGNAAFAIQYNHFLIRYTFHYTGYRYTSSDNREYLNPYKLHSLYLSYKFSIRSVETDLFLQINNLSDEDYYVMQNRPMPLRNFRAGINFNFNHK